MTKQERVTGAVVVVLALVGAWFAWTLWSGGSLDEPRLGAMIGAVVLLALLSSIAAGAAALAGSGRVDERDRKVAVRSQAVRGYFYLVVTYGALAYAVMQGSGVLANGLFLAILAVELVSGLVMLALYRRAG